MRRTFAPSILAALVLAASASGQTEILARVIPVAGSTPGAFGSFFRTGLQLRNAGDSPLSGRFVYHPAGASGSGSDPSLSFSAGAGETLSYPDIIQTMGLSGLGSLDLLVLPAASSSPVVVTRVFNDAGAAGTSGYTEDAIDPAASGAGDALLSAGARGVLIAPADPAEFRFNIGVRTLSSGASLAIQVRAADGVLARTVLKSFGPTFFVQQSSDVFLGGPLASGDSIEIRVTAGSAIVYGATVDNRTNDPSIQFARAL